jgi:predicted RNase H-like nuclease (RuvC/YqgF family)
MEHKLEGHNLKLKAKVRELQQMMSLTDLLRGKSSSESDEVVQSLTQKLAQKAEKVKQLKAQLVQVQREGENKDAIARNNETT